MRFIRALFMVVTAFVLMTAPTMAQDQPPAKQVYAYYMGWWTNESWGDATLSDRPSQPYDSRDAGALGRHIDEAKSAGIDAFIISWFGPANNNLTHTTFNALLDQAAARGFQIGVSVDMFQADYLFNMDTVREALTHIINDRSNHPAYLRHQGKPVIYFWNQGRFSITDWQTLRNELDPNRNTIWVMEGTNTRYLSVFDGLYLFSTSWGNPATVATTWASRVRSAGGTFYSPTVIPGWDESAIAARDNRENPADTVSRGSGDYLTRSWNGAVASGGSPILIVSWNEYFENSHIEPSQSFGTTALDTLRPLVQAWKSAPAAASAPGAGAPSGLTFTAQYTVNLRAEPTTDAAVVAKIPVGAVVEVVGRTGDSAWLRVNYDGGGGWVAAYLGVLNGAIDQAPVQ